MNTQTKLVLNVLLSLLAAGFFSGCSLETDQAPERRKSQTSTLSNEGKGGESNSQENKGHEDAVKEVASSDSTYENVEPKVDDETTSLDERSSNGESSNSPSDTDLSSRRKYGKRGGESSSEGDSSTSTPISEKKGRRGGDSSSEGDSSASTPMSEKNSKRGGDSSAEGDSSASTPMSEKNSKRGGDSSSEGGSSTSSPTSNAFLKANLTNFESYPDPGSEECIEYNGCTWAGQFAALDDTQSESWVKANNIAAVHSKDFAKYKLKTLRVKSGSKQIDVKVYDMCSDSDCDGCCTANMKGTGFLLDLEKYTVERFGAGDGIVEWTCLDCN